MMNGGYDNGYKKCPCFWGDHPGSLLIELEGFIQSFENLKVLDIGCGEGKNSIYLAKKGCMVDGFEVSSYALENAKTLCEEHENIKLFKKDVTKINYPNNHYDIIISYGLFHCLASKKEVELLIKKTFSSLKKNGFYVLCSFNSRKQDLSGHENFDPLLLDHSEYVNFFEGQTIISSTDTDLFETHPHNNIPHVHSMTRIIIKKNKEL